MCIRDRNTTSSINLTNTDLIELIGNTRKTRSVNHGKFAIIKNNKISAVGDITKKYYAKTATQIAINEPGNTPKANTASAFALIITRISAGASSLCCSTG